ncbi:SDR family oxidoreductase [Brumimicrobium aurantiacum]|uniref:SDR family oxidoreductase n=1 Tax=Brumimicrobium aurantiacum TaxID=1737063 RepID=A0A3E1F116_9FLAO|nr:SDR family oxidoreductase [Brumimicrobium aurantiacum]RFC55498.1 SDR family oxidoreductase [Brumimicrobium aurantiacum]
MKKFANKVVWITGASSGIGKEIAIQLAKLGSKLILSARNVEELEKLKLSLNCPENHMVLRLDLAENENFLNLTKQVVEKYQRIDYLFNSGGISQRSEASTTSMDVDRRIMEVNYFGNIALTKAVLPIMQRQKSGHIIVTSSIAGKFGFYLRSAYAASKHALHGFYESVSLEEAKYNISVTIVCPGKINTPISKSALTADGTAHGEMDHNQATGMSVEECVRQILKATLKKKKEVLIGNKEILAAKIKRFFPSLFWRIIKNQSPT